MLKEKRVLMVADGEELVCMTGESGGGGSTTFEDWALQSCPWQGQSLLAVRWGLLLACGLLSYYFGLAALRRGSICVVPLCPIQAVALPLLFPICPIPKHRCLLAPRALGIHGRS